MEDNKQTLTTEDLPFEQAASLFGSFKERFASLLDDLTMNENKRLTKALVEYPLQDKEWVDKYSSDKLREAFRLGEALLQSKMIMMMIAAQEQEAEKQKLLQEQLQTTASETNNQSVEPNGENNNVEQ